MEKGKKMEVEQLTAREIRIVDEEGRERISMISGCGGPSICLYNKEEIPILILDVIDIGGESGLEEISVASLMMQNDDEQTMVHMGITSCTSGGKLPYLELSDKNGNLITALFTSGDGNKKRIPAMILPNGRGIPLKKIRMTTAAQVAVGESMLPELKMELAASLREEKPMAATGA